MFDKAYESYKKKCKELGIKASSKKDVFGEDITRKKNKQHVNISELSAAKKQKAPILSDTAKKAIEVKTNKMVKKKRVVQTEEEKKAKRNAWSKAYYAANREKILAKKSKKVFLTDDEKKEIAREKARLYHLKMKNDPAYQERRKKNAKKWQSENKEKIAAINKKYRDEVRTPEWLEEKRRKQREYRQKNLEKIRAQDRARAEQRKEYIKNNPEAHERKKARERERYEKKRNDPIEAEKLREKWRKDGARKRELV